MTVMSRKIKIATVNNLRNVRERESAYPVQEIFCQKCIYSWHISKSPVKPDFSSSSSATSIVSIHVDRFNCKRTSTAFADIPCDKKQLTTCEIYVCERRKFFPSFPICTSRVMKMYGISIFPSLLYSTPLSFYFFLSLSLSFPSLHFDSHSNTTFSFRIQFYLLSSRIA